MRARNAFLRMQIKKWFFLGFFLILLPPIANASNAKLTNLNVTEIKTGTIQLTFQLSTPSQPNVFTLSNPNRFVLDFNTTGRPSYLRMHRLCAVIKKKCLTNRN